MIHYYLEHISRLLTPKNFSASMLSTSPALNGGVRCSQNEADPAGAGIGLPYPLEKSMFDISYKAFCEKNIENRLRLTVMHCGRSKSFGQYQYELVNAHTYISNDFLEYVCVYTLTFINFRGTSR